ncbi:hypothetical protein BDA99DRAFT_540158 [Phascolomyces articulosus]|uniref:Uncharacterized protein n=1 Tax=Phascolomyces articulosus TaxID=60185 RepID=A0AAD5PB26_9FUNG|nr:hypothetical protein BDA99DRAFT_540158 [Phascolomyces articulosus]
MATKRLKLIVLKKAGEEYNRQNNHEKLLEIAQLMLELDNTYIQGHYFAAIAYGLINDYNQVLRITKQFPNDRSFMYLATIAHEHKRLNHKSDFVDWFPLNL